MYGLRLPGNEQNKTIPQTELFHLIQVELNTR